MAPCCNSSKFSNQGTACNEYVVRFAFATNQQSPSFKISKSISQEPIDAVPVLPTQWHPLRIHHKPRVISVASERCAIFAYWNLCAVKSDLFSHNDLSKVATTRLISSQASDESNQELGKSALSQSGNQHKVYDFRSILLVACEPQKSPNFTMSLTTR